MLEAALVFLLPLEDVAELLGLALLVLERVLLPELFPLALLYLL